MKMVVLWFLLCSTLYADETLTGLFKELKTVSKEDKFKVVNEIKKHIIQLKQQERVDAIKVLKAKKEAELKASSVDIAENSDIEVPESMAKNKEKMADSMEEMKDVKEMTMPSTMQKMDQIPNIQNMSTMKNMPLIKDIKTIKELRATGQTPSVSTIQEMRGNR